MTTRHRHIVFYSKYFLLSLRLISLVPLLASILSFSFLRTHHYHHHHYHHSSISRTSGCFTKYPKLYGSGVRSIGEADTDTDTDASNQSESSLMSLSHDDRAEFLLRELYPSTPMLYNGTIAVFSPNLSSKTISIDNQDGDDVRMLSHQHAIYYEVYGNNQGEPALFLHGGPGAGCFPRHACFFDPNYYRIVLVDQRGCGRSTPRGEIIDNDTQFLVDDCEVLRIELNIDHWKVVLGGSWGSTLTLSYAQKYPSSIRNIILRGVCLMRPFEVDWLFGSGEGVTSSMNKQSWNNFANAVYPLSEEKSDIEISNFTQRTILHEYGNWFLSGTWEHRFAASQSWSQWEMGMSRFNSNDNDKYYPEGILVWKENHWCLERRKNPGAETSFDMHTLASSLRKMNHSSVNRTSPMLKFERSFPRHNPPEVNHTALKARNISKEMYDSYLSHIPAQAILTCWYSINNGFIDVPLLSKACIDRISHIPCIAIHGGNDFICPVDNALDLLEMWPSIDLRIPLQSSHSMYDSLILHELLCATDRLRDN